MRRRRSRMTRDALGGVRGRAKTGVGEWNNTFDGSLCEQSDLAPQSKTLACGYQCLAVHGEPGRSIQPSPSNTERSNPDEPTDELEVEGWGLPVLDGAGWVWLARCAAPGPAAPRACNRPAS